MTADMTRKFPRPDGHHSLTPGFAVPNAGKVIEFLERAFDAKLIERYAGPGGSVAHAELRIGDSVVMLGDAGEHMQPMPASLSYYVDNGEAVDRVYQRAIQAGAKSEMEPKNQFYGYRSATVRDVGGNKWTICAVVEQVSAEELERRMKEMKP
ncbi:MAG TPA: VOC family protein [Kofleriaceae bacterium]|jgi:PhnB protein